MLDEFPRLAPSEFNDGFLQPQIEECASILSKFVQRSGNTKRLLVTSAALTETSVKQCFWSGIRFSGNYNQTICAASLCGCTIRESKFAECMRTTCGDNIESSRQKRDNFLAWLEGNYDCAKIGV